MSQLGRYPELPFYALQEPVIGTSQKLSIWGELSEWLRYDGLRIGKYMISQRKNKCCGLCLNLLELALRGFLSIRGRFVAYVEINSHANFVSSPN